jgi:peptidoglycan hydrolase CwlO-like protein
VTLKNVFDAIHNQNKQNYFNMINEIQKQLNALDNQINRLNDVIREKDNKIKELEDKLYVLNVKRILFGNGNTSNHTNRR